MVISNRVDSVALLSYCCDTGVGLTGLAFYTHLPFGRWLVVPHRKLGVHPRYLNSRSHILPHDLQSRDLEEGLSGVKVLCCIERGYYPRLFRLAQQLGIRTILMPNAEWFKPEDPDIAAVSAFIAPTIACFEMLKSCNCGSRTTYIPHAIDTERFSFRRRETAETFLHCSGWGGHKDRKGTDIVFRVAEACPEIPVVIRSQKFCQYSLPNIIIHGPTIDPEMQYDRGDICVQPSRWEGVGLQILEAMACGLPTVVPDAPPMNEYQADSVLRVKAHSGPVLVGTKPWTQWEIDHESLAATLRRLHHQQIGDLSIRARKFVEQRSWAVLKADYMRLIGF